MVLRPTVGERVLLGALITLFIALSLLIDVPAEEDAFIYYRYAEHWARGMGLVFNHGEWVEGYSSALWMGALALLARLGTDLPTGAPLLSILCGAGTLLATRFLARELGLGQRDRVLACTSVTLSFPFLFWSRSGLDTTCYALLLTAFAALYLGNQYPAAPTQSASARHQYLGGVLLLLIALCRPEGVLLALVVVVDRWWDHRDWTGLRRYLGPWALGYGLCMAVRYTVYGAFTPNTSVKFNPYNAGAGLSQTLSYLCYLGGIPLLLAGWTLWHREVPIGKRGALRFLAVTVLIVSVSFQIASGGDYRPGFRFLLPTLPLVVTACWYVFSSLRGGLVDWVRGPLPSFFCLALLLLPSLWSLGQNLAQPHGQNWPTQWRDPLADEQDYHATAARWVLAHIPPGSTVAFGQMGKAPYYALVTGKNLTFIDTIGLLDTRLSHLLGLGHKVATFWHFWSTGNGFSKTYQRGREHIHSQVSDYLLRERKPDFVIIESAFLQNRSVQTLLTDPDFLRSYVLQASVPSQDQPGFLVYARTA